MGWGTYNLVSTGGALLLALGGVLLLYNVVRSRISGPPAGDNPWGADTLEWSVSSPPPVYNFLHVPVVEGRNALWDRSAGRPIVKGLSSTKREVLVSTVLDGEPDNRYEYPGPTIWPFLTAVVTSAFFVASIFTAWAVPVFALPLAVTLTGWFWPKRGED
jgi:hypothetical protein